MATGAKMSYNYYQNGKYGTLPQNPGKDMEVTQDMHLKMSKKIAQLTKVSALSCYLTCVKSRTFLKFGMLLELASASCKYFD